MQKIRNFILSRLGELLNTLQNVHPPGAPGPRRGAPPGGSPRPRSVYPPGGLVDGWGYPSTPTVVFPQPLFPRDVRCGLFRTQTSLSTRFDQRQVLTHTLTRDWVPSSSQSLRPRHLWRSRGLSHFAPTGWGISSLAGAFPSGGSHLLYTLVSGSLLPSGLPSRGLVEFRRHDGLLLRPMAREPGSRLCLPRPLRGVLAQHRGPSSPFCHRRQGLQGPLRAPDPRGAKKCTFLPPCGAKS